MKPPLSWKDAPSVLVADMAPAIVSPVVLMAPAIGPPIIAPAVILVLFIFATMLLTATSISPTAIVWVPLTRCSYRSGLS